MGECGRGGGEDTIGQHVVRAYIKSIKKKKKSKKNGWQVALFKIAVLWFFCKMVHAPWAPE